MGRSAREVPAPGVHELRPAHLSGGPDRPPRPGEHLWLTVVAFVAALPSLSMALVGGFMTDDWGVWLQLEERGLGESLRFVGFEQPGRILAGPYYVLLYDVIGDVPWLQALVLAAANAAVVAAAWLVGHRLLPAAVLWPALVVLALVPNHAMTRLWFVAGYYVVALTLALLGMWQLDKRRPWQCAACFVVAALFFEGVLGLALGALALWTLCDLRHRLRDAVVVAIPTLGTAAAAYLLSSKRGGTIPFNNADSFFAGQLGVGLWGEVWLARSAGAVVLLAITLAIARHLPSFRSSAPEHRIVLAGAALAVAGALPYLATGAAFATSGMFDRTNLMPSVGVALIFGGTWSLLYRRSRPGAAVIAVAVVAVFALGQVEDVRNWADAVEHGDTVAARLARSGADDTEVIIVVPQQEGERTGMADFIYDADLTGAMRYRYGGDWSRVRLIERVGCESPRFGTGRVQVFDWRTSSVRWAAASEVDSRCEQLRDG